MYKTRLLLAALVVAAACGGNEPAPPPAPTGPTPEELERRRQDSIARAQAAEEARQRAEQERMEREAARRAESLRRTLQEVVYFDYDESTVRSDSTTQNLLQAKAEILRNNPAVSLRMEGHADERGTSEYNIALGNERAEAVIQALSAFGLDSSRFTSVSYGEERPVAQGSTESAWARNRRVEFVVTAGGDNLR